MKTRLFTTMIVLAGIFAGSSAFAQDGHFAQTHPRRAEVNSRLRNQNARIDRKEADGQMGAREAGKLHREDHQIRQEERDMASQDHGHITRQEQRTLNQQENHSSRQIHNH